MINRYNKYSDYMVKLFGSKVYKIPLNLPVTCPNRDGEISQGGCTFCGDQGAGFECLEPSMGIKEQYTKNMAYIGEKYKASKGIAYLQNFSNTYMKLESFEKVVEELLGIDIVGVSLSTRPDCISTAYLDILKKAQQIKNWHVTIEYGLQTVNYHTLDKINRGHGLAAFIDAVTKTHQYGFDTCAHLILNLPWDTDRDAEEAAAILNVLSVKQIKIHGLYILKNTPMGHSYLNEEYTLISAEEYVKRVVSFIRRSSPNVVFQRLAGRAPANETLFCNWSMSWWKVVEMIDKELESQGAYQGDQCIELSSKAVNKWI